MIKHHEGALIMVKDLFDNNGAGQESEVFAFVSDVEADQQMEIDRMYGMLKELPEMTARFLCLSVVVLFATLSGGAQEQPGNANNKDPRVGLKAGFRDAGEAAMNMERLSSLPKPQGSMIPSCRRASLRRQSGTGMRTRRRPRRCRTRQQPRRTPPQPRRKKRQRRKIRIRPQNDPRRQNRLSFANSDLAFRGNQLVMGSFHGFNTYDIENARRPRLIGPSPAQARSDARSTATCCSCRSSRHVDGSTAARRACRRRSARALPRHPIFDITDVKKPKQIAAIQTCRGSPRTRW